MKKLLFLVGAAAIMAACSPTNEPKTITICGEFSNQEIFQDSTQVILAHSGLITEKRGESAFDTAYVSNGKYQFKTIESSIPLFLRIETRRMTASFSANPGDTILITNGKVDGSTVPEELSKLPDNFWGYYNSGNSKIWRANKDMILEIDSLERLNKRTEVAEIKNSEAYTKYLIDKAAWHKEYADSLYRLFKHEKSIFPLMALGYSAGVIELQEKYYDELAPEVKNSIYGQGLRNKLDLKLKGKKAPEFKLADRDGKEYTIADLIGDNNYLILDFWASWCVPCRRGIPVLHGLVEKYSKEGIATCNISTDTDRDAWLKALDEEKMTWANVHDADGSVKKAYGVYAIPAVFMVAKDGTIIFEKCFGDEINTALINHFGY